MLEKPKECEEFPKKKWVDRGVDPQIAASFSDKRFPSSGGNNAAFINKSISSQWCLKVKDMLIFQAVGSSSRVMLVCCSLESVRAWAPHTQGWKHFMLHYSCKERRFTSHHSFVAYDGFFSVVFWVQTCCEQCFYLICKYRDINSNYCFFFAKKSSIDLKCAASERKKKSNEHIFINMMVISFWRLLVFCICFDLFFPPLNKFICTSAESWLRL